ncbi:hypothetical protein D3C76_337340 [compost metagenome]|uniref:hypothetical protein n=1 Tax=Pseudomonas TaxID=286 RepID=UPI000FB87798|nr:MULTISPECIES: hypothetical protein [Pseudomonas]VVP23862.1 hypothetical protein PS843_03928 [Pseudomonas fluorescens]
MRRSSKPDELKNPRRVMAGKMAYERRKAAQDEADKPAMEIVKAVVAVICLIGFAPSFSAKVT